MNTTKSTSMTTKINKTFYDRQLLESAKTRFVFANYGQKRSLPRNNGKRVEFRRWELFDPADAVGGLQEGVTPTGQDLTQSSVEAEIHQYGAYVEVSDVLDMTSYDNVINDSVELLGEQLGTVVEWVTRDALCEGTNVQYPQGVSERNKIMSSHLLTVDDVRRAVRSLKKAKARMFSGKGRKPHYICICSPEATFDLQNDEKWLEASRYANTEQIYDGELGKMYGVVFIESTECKVIKTQFSNGENSTTTSITLSHPLTAEQLSYLENGGTLNIGGVQHVSVNIGELTVGASTLKLVDELDASPLESTVIVGEDAAKDGADVYTTLIFGKDAYGVVDIDGSDTVQTIIKPCGSAGTSDPLNQRATIGAKVAGYAAAILNDLWIVRIEHCVSE